MEIREITGDKRRYLPLLLVGDEQEEMVMRYLPHGSLFVCFDPRTRAPSPVVAPSPRATGYCELKNLAVEPCRQRQGHGRRMVAFVVRRYAEQGYRTLRVGTAKRPRRSASMRSAASAPQAASPTFLPAITTTRSSRRASCCAT